MASWGEKQLGICLEGGNLLYAIMESTMSDSSGVDNRRVWLVWVWKVATMKVNMR